MAVLQGVKEKVHLPIYDSLVVEGSKQLREAENSSIIKFFVDVQRKTKLETNLQSASLLPHYNTFEARAMRVVISDLPPQFSDENKVEVPDLEVRDKATTPTTQTFTATYEADVATLMDMLADARGDSEHGETSIGADEPGVTLDGAPSGTDPKKFEVILSVSDIEGTLEKDRLGPAKEQIHVGNGAGNLIGRLIYTTVTTLFVGEKIMISMPTFFFPAGAGPYSESGGFTTHGEPSPTATFRFAEPIFIDRQQNFRVEIEIPDSDVLAEVQKIYGPLYIWVVLDGYMTRDVQ